MAAVMGGNVRVGLEDSLWLGRGELANAEPVVVIDGMRYVRGGVDMLASLSPREVKRIEVLKDVALTPAIVRDGTSGVIVVTTRRGDY